MLHLAHQVDRLACTAQGRGSWSLLTVGYLPRSVTTSGPEMNLMEVLCAWARVASRAADSRRSVAPPILALTRAVNH